MAAQTTRLIPDVPLDHAMFGSWSSPTSYAVFVTMLIFFGVVVPAVWSRKATRRSAALRVLDRLLRLFGR